MKIDDIQHDILERIQKSIKPRKNSRIKIKRKRRKRRKSASSPILTNSRQTTSWKISKAKTGKALTDKHKANIGKGMRKKWFVFDKRGKLYETSDMKSFCKEKGLVYSCMSAVNCGKIKQHKGWTCEKAQ